MEIDSLDQIYEDLEIVTRLLDQAIKIQEIPAPTFAEHERASFVQKSFLEEGLIDVTIDQYGNVYGRLPGVGTEPPVVISAHLDTVFPDYTDLSVREETGKIFGPGIGDNAMGVAGLFGLLWVIKKKWPSRSKKLSQSSLPGDIWFVANVGEEGLGDLCGMRALVKRFGESVLAYLIIEGMAFGQIYHRALGVHRYRITVRTNGGHSWVDYGRPSAVHVLADIITSLTKLHIPSQPRSSLNVGVVSGGTSVNTVAAEAHLELDLRSESAEVLEELTQQVQAIVDLSRQPDIQVSVETIGRRPAGEISREHPLVQLAINTLSALGVQANLTIGSTDANIPLSQGLPAICVGMTTGYGAHTVNEYIYTEPVTQGLTQLVHLVEGVFRLGKNTI